MNNLLEKPLFLRVNGIGIVIFNIFLSAYIYSNFSNIITWLPALFALGTAIFFWREADRLDQLQKSK